MSPDEQRELRVRLKVELEEAETELVHLREAANFKSDLFYQLAEWLRTQPELYIYWTGGSIHHGFDVKPLHEKYIKALDFNSLLSLADEIRKLQKRVTDLQARSNRL